MLNCKQATTLVSQSLDSNLRWSQRLRLKLHLFICHWCRAYAHQLRFLHRHIPEIEARIEAQPGQNLSPEAKASIRARLKPPP